MRDVEVVIVELEVATERRDQCYAWLSDEERDRAARFRFDRDRDRYVVCRGNLREMLGERLGVAPAEIAFSYNAHGKPETRGVEFNVSHSGSRALIAISRARVVGVDIERMNRGFMHEQIPERFFSPGEVRALRALPEAGQVEAFFHCWTRKEAYVKARGLGLSLALDGFDVSLGHPACFLRGVEGWEIESVNAGDGFAAAVVAEGCR